MSDITTGYSFSSGEKNVNHTKLNNSLNNATINASFFTGKSASAAPGTGYLALLYDPSGTTWYKATLANLIFDHDELLKDRTQDTTPAAADRLLTYDDDAAGYKYVTLANLFKNADADLISEQTTLATPETTDTLLLFDVDADALKEVTRANLFYQWWNILNLDDGSLTALTGAGAISESDTLIVADNDDSDNTKKITIGGLLLYLTAGASGVEDADSFLCYDDSAAGGRKVLGSDIKTYVQSGCIVQIQQTAKTDTFNSSSTGAWTDITGMSVSITPSSTSNTVLVSFQINGVCNGNNVHFRLVRDSTTIGVGDSGGGGDEQSTAGLKGGTNNTIENVSMEFIDSPSKATSTTYKLQFYLESGDWWLNRNDSGGDDYARFISVITAKEIAA